MKIGDMETRDTHESIHPKGEQETVLDTPIVLDTFAGRVHVEWDPEAAVTPLGQLGFFIDFLKTAELWEPWVADCPQSYTSNNAPRIVDVLGTLFLTVLAGHDRYAHADAMRWDRVNPPLLGMSKVMSASSARRAFS